MKKFLILMLLVTQSCSQQTVESEDIKNVDLVKIGRDMNTRSFQLGALSMAKAIEENPIIVAEPMEKQIKYAEKYIMRYAAEDIYDFQQPPN